MGASRTACSPQLTRREVAQGLAGGAGWLACTSGATAAELRPITMHEAINLPVAEVEDLSCGAGDVLLTYRAPGADQKVSIIRAGRAVEIATGACGGASPDGRYLLYLAGARWILRDLNSGTERTFDLAHTPFTLEPPAWSRDSRYAAVMLQTIPERVRPTGDLGVVDTGGVRTEDVGETAALRRDALRSHLSPQLLIWDVTADAPTVTLVRATAGYPGAWGRAPDDLHSYYFSQGQHPYGGDAPYTAVLVHSAPTGASRELYRNGCFSQGCRPRISPDGRTLAFAVDLDMPAFGVSNSLVFLDRLGGDVKTPVRDLSVVSVAWGNDGAIYFLARDGGFQQLWTATAAGGARQLTHDAVKRTELCSRQDDQQLFYFTLDGFGRRGVSTWDLETKLEQSVASFAEPPAQWRLGAFTRYLWHTADGLSLNGFLVLPPDFSLNRRYPLFVDVHGGGPGTPLLLTSLLGLRATAPRRETPLEWHGWAALGYVVFVPDYRSSGEYGAAVNLRVAEGADGDNTGIVRDAMDVEAGVRALVQEGYIDPKRVVLFGHSAGGGRVDYLLTRSRMYAAGIISDPIGAGNQADDIELASQGLPVIWRGAEPLADTARARQVSGFLFDGWRNKTPTLIMVGNPARGALNPMSAEVMYSMLASMKTPVRLVRFVDDGHIPSSGISAERRFELMREWIDRFA